MDPKGRLSAYRILALGVSAISVCTLFSASVSLPLAFLYIQRVQNGIKVELNNCKLAARDILVDVSELKAVSSSERSLQHILTSFQFPKNFDQLQVLAALEIPARMKVPACHSATRVAISAAFLVHRDLLALLEGQGDLGNLVPTVLTVILAECSWHRFSTSPRISA